MRSLLQSASNIFWNYSKEIKIGSGSLGANKPTGHVFLKTVPATEVCFIIAMLCLAVFLLHLSVDYIGLCLAVCSILWLKGLLGRSTRSFYGRMNNAKL